LEGRIAQMMMIGGRNIRYTGMPAGWALHF